MKRLAILALLVFVTYLPFSSYAELRLTPEESEIYLECTISCWDKYNFAEGVNSASEDTYYHNLCTDICRAEIINFRNASKPTVPADGSLWGAFVEGQSTPDMGNVRYPFDIYGVSWNYPNPESAIASATKECKKRGGSNCGGEGRGERAAFSSSADGSTGEFVVAKCIRVTITSTPVLSGLNQVRMTYDLDNPMNPSPPFLSWGPGAKTLSNNIYCNDK